MIFDALFLFMNLIYVLNVRIKELLCMWLLRIIAKVSLKY